MNSSKPLLSLITFIAFIHGAAATAAGIDMDDPRRALGREDDVRIDAQLLRDTVSPNAPIGITYQVENLSGTTIAIADKVSDSSYDDETRTITVAIGSEVPPDGSMPHMVVIRSGEKKVLQTAARAAMSAAAMRSSFAAVPRFVQVKVAILRNVAPFEKFIERQDGRTRQRLSDEQFDSWIEGSGTIFLNSIPVRFAPADSTDVERSASRAGF